MLHLHGYTQLLHGIERVSWVPCGRWLQVYTQLSTTLSNVFFPGKDPAVKALSVWGIFAGAWLCSDSCLHQQSNLLVAACVDVQPAPRRSPRRLLQHFVACNTHLVSIAIATHMSAKQPLVHALMPPCHARPL